MSDLLTGMRRTGDRVGYIFGGGALLFVFGDMFIFPGHVNASLDVAILGFLSGFSGAGFCISLVAKSLLRGHNN